MILQREQLDKMGCAHQTHDPEDCHEGPLFFHARCHIDSPTWVQYANGVVTVICAECGEPIAQIAVKGDPEPRARIRRRPL